MRATPRLSIARWSTTPARADLREAWDAFWFAPTPARNLAVARIVLSATALWVVLSRFDLPSVMTFPEPMWTAIPAATRFRFAMWSSLAVERVLYVLLHVALLLTMFGLRPRATALASALLLYHFAPFETIIWTGNPYLRGLTFPLLGLLFLVFSPDFARATLRSDDEVPRWPIALCQIVIAQMYFFAGYAKLFTSGFRWAGEANMRRWLILLDQLYGAPGWEVGTRLAGIHGVPAAIGAAALAFELLFPLALFSRRARLFFVPAAVLFHIGNILLFHIFFQELPVLLLFVEWRRRRRDQANNARVPLPSSWHG